MKIASCHVGRKPVICIQYHIGPRHHITWHDYFDVIDSEGNGPAIIGDIYSRASILYHGMSDASGITPAHWRPDHFSATTQISRIEHY